MVLKGVVDVILEVCGILEKDLEVFVEAVQILKRF